MLSLSFYIECPNSVPRMGRTNQGLTTMASITIEKRNKANGESNYCCKVRVKKNGVIIHSASKTFSKKNMLVHGEKLELIK